MIQLKCPNGHLLKVEDRWAGHAGSCPRCHSRVVVPHPQPPVLSDDVIAEWLGAPAPTQSPPAEEPRSPSPRPELAQALHAHRTKFCPNCGAEVSAGYALCIYCKTYFRNAEEVVRRMHDE